LDRIFYPESRRDRLVLATLCVAVWALVEAANQIEIFFLTADKTYVWKHYFPALWSQSAFLVVAAFLVPLVVISLTLFLLLEVLRPRFPLFVFVSFQLSTFFLLAARNPQLMEDFLIFNRVDRIIFPVLAPAAVIFALLFCVSLMPSANFKKRLGARWVLWLFVPLYVLYFNFPLFPLWWNSQRLRPGIPQVRGNIILIGIDGFDPSLVKEIIDSNRYPEFTHFARSSDWYQNSYTEIARTEPSLIGLLSGIPPHKSQARVTLQNSVPALLETEKQNHIQKWLRAGGEVVARISDSDYINLPAETSFIRDVRKPASQIFSLTAPYVLRSTLLFAYFNNALFSWLLPEVLENSSFQNSYDPRVFLRAVRKDLSQLRRPTIYLSHLTVLHWPGSFPYPYYLFRNEKDESIGGQFSYSGLTDPDFLNQNNRTRYTSFNERLYRKGHQMVMDLYLEPLLEDLRNSGVLDQSTVVVYSDHSENFFKSGVPDLRVPSHGSWIPSADQSYRTTLMIRRPGSNQGSEIQTLMPLHKALVESLSPLEGPKPFESAEEVRVFESDWWFSELFSEEFWQLKPKRSSFQMNGSLVFLGDTEIQAGLRSKIRGFRWKNLDYILYPTIRGFYWTCSGDKENCDLSKSWQLFREQYREDFKSGNLPDLKIGKQYLGRFARLNFSPRAGDLWERAIFATTELNSYRNLRSFQAEARSILSVPGLPRPLHRLMTSQLLRLCSKSWSRIFLASGASVIDHPPLSFRTDMIEDRSDINSLAVCWKTGGGYRTREIGLFLRRNRRQLWPWNAREVGLGSYFYLEHRPNLDADQSQADWPFWLSSFEIASSLPHTPEFLGPSELAEKLDQGTCRVSVRQNEEREVSCDP